MKPFRLEEYLKNPSRKVVTRDKRNVRIVCTDAKGKYPVTALVEHYDGISENAFVFTEDGRYLVSGTDDKDLFFPPEKKIGWVNIWEGVKAGDRYCGNTIHTSEEEAKGRGSIATIKIEWEEE